MDTQIDPTIKNLVSAIGKAETGEAGGESAYTKSGKSGEYGRYQFMPNTWKQWAKETLKDENAPMTIENQNKVAYNKVKEWKDRGLTPAQIASKWNSGGENKYKEGWKGETTLKDGTKVAYDTPAYTLKVSQYYNELKGKNQSNIQPQEDLTKGTVVPSSQQTQPQDLKVKSDPVTDLIPGYKLAQGAGYGLASALGSQKGLIEANNRGMDIQGQLLKQIKDNKAKGKDTARLEKALKQLGLDLKEQASQVVDAGTGGITNKEVLKSAGSLATLPAAAYATTALGGGGLMGTSRGLVSGQRGVSAIKELSRPSIKELLSPFRGNASRADALQTLQNALQEIKVSDIGTKYEKEILQAIKSLSPELKQSLLKRFSSGVASEATRFVLYNALGSKAGGIVEKLLP